MNHRDAKAQLKGHARHVSPGPLLALAFLLAVAGPALAAERAYATHIGRTVLARADMIVLGSVSQTATRTGQDYARSLVVSEVLHGTTRLPEVQVFYSDARSFTTGDNRVIVALTAVAGSESAFRLHGEKLRIDQDDEARAIKAYITLDKDSETLSARLAALKALIARHLDTGGRVAWFGAIELGFLIGRNPELFAHDDYDGYRATLRGLGEDAGASVLRQAIEALVTSVLKPDAQVVAGKDTEEGARLAAVARLEIYLADYPAVFSDNDARRCDLLAANAPRRVKLALETHRDAIRAKLRARELAAREAGGDGPVRRGEDTGAQGTRRPPGARPVPPDER